LIKIATFGKIQPMKSRAFKGQLIIFLGLLIWLGIVSGYANPIMIIAIPFMMADFSPAMFILFGYNMAMMYALRKKNILIKSVLPSIPLLILYFVFREDYDGSIEIKSFFWNDQARISMMVVMWFLLSLIGLNFLAFLVSKKKNE
jgi:hypothetical protein